MKLKPREIACADCGAACTALSGMTYRCRPCQKKQDRISERAMCKRYYVANAEKVNAQRKAFRKSNVEKLRQMGRKQQGIKDATGESLSGNCEICGLHFKKLHYDHDHDTGLFRGWLCNRCNVGVGMLGDDADVVRAAETYLRRTKKRPLRLA